MTFFTFLYDNIYICIIVFIILVLIGILIFNKVYFGYWIIGEKRYKKINGKKEKKKKKKKNKVKVVEKKEDEITFDDKKEERREEEIEIKEETDTISDVEDGSLEI